jgi:SAM-dependent methyltransferase
MFKLYSKVAIQQLLSVLPGGSPMYRWIQDNIANTTSPNAEMLQEKINQSLNYLQILKDSGDGAILKKGVHLEVGAGCQFTIPLTFYMMGCNKQVLTDINRNAVKDSVFPVVDLLSRCNMAGQLPIRDLPETGQHDLDSYLSQMGIKYKAPTSGNFPVPDKSISLVTMTSVLEYIPYSQMHGFLKEVIRVLKPGGYFMGMLYLTDQFKCFDQSISSFNFLRFQEKTWERLFCSKFNTLNRMRPSDYKSVFEGLPFKTLAWDIVHPSDSDFKELGRIKISSDFSGYNPEDLASTHLYFAFTRDTHDVT